MIIAIDGPAGSGKSSLSRELAKKSDFTYLDTGAMYRALTLLCLERGIDPRDEDVVERVAQHLDISFADAPKGTEQNAEGASETGQRVFANGQEVTDAIRTAEVDENVSLVALHPNIRKIMVEKQRAFAKGAKIKFPRPHRVFYKTAGLLTFESLGDFDKKEQLEVMEKTAMDIVYKLRKELWEEFPNVE